MSEQPIVDMSEGSLETPLDPELLRGVPLNVPWHPYFLNTIARECYVVLIPNYLCYSPGVYIFVLYSTKLCYLCIVFLKHITALSRSERIYMKGHFSDSKSRAFPRWTSDIFGGPWFINTAKKYRYRITPLKIGRFPCATKTKQKTSSGLSSRIRKTLETNCGKWIRWKWIYHLGGDFSIEPEDCASVKNVERNWMKNRNDWIHRIHPRFGLHNLVFLYQHNLHIWKSFSNWYFSLPIFVWSITFFLVCRLLHRCWGWAWLLF